MQKAIENSKAAIAKHNPSNDSIARLQTMERIRLDLQTEADALYASLNVHGTFPEFNGIDLEFVYVLLMARDLKISIRRRAIASFFEWDKLDQAVGGRGQPLGMFGDFIVCWLCELRVHTLTVLSRYQTSPANKKSYRQTQTCSHGRHHKVQWLLFDTRKSLSDVLVYSTSQAFAEHTRFASQQPYPHGRCVDFTIRGYSALAR